MQGYNATKMHLLKVKDNEKTRVRGKKIPFKEIMPGLAVEDNEKTLLRRKGNKKQGFRKMEGGN